MRSCGRFGFPLLIFLLLILPMLSPQANIVERIVVPPVQCADAACSGVG